MEIYTFLAGHKKASVGEVVEHMKLTQPTVSYHLKDMKEWGILKSKKIGKEVYYSINSVCPHSRERCILNNVRLQS